MRSSQVMRARWPSLLCLALLCGVAGAQASDAVVEARGRWILRWKSGDPTKMSLRDQLRPAELSGRLLVRNQMSQPLTKAMVNIVVARDEASRAAGRTAFAMATIVFKPPLAPGAEAERPFTASVLVLKNTDLATVRTFSLGAVLTEPATSATERLMRAWGRPAAASPVDGGAP